MKAFTGTGYIKPVSFLRQSIKQGIKCNNHQEKHTCSGTALNSITAFKYNKPLLRQGID